MSTSGDRTAWPQGWPDVATLEHLANEFFSAPPGVNPVGVDPVSRLDSIPHDLKSDFPGVGTDPATAVLPGEAELQAHLQTLLRTLQTEPAGIPATPVPMTGPSFYFLESTVPLADLPRVTTPFDVNLVRRDFPILQERVDGRQLVWLDNAATTQKPQAVIDRLKHFYEHENSNIHRAAHELAARATDAYEEAREKVRGFLNAASANEIVFVRGATEAINLVAQSWGRQNIGKDDEIVITWLEHHANIVPWQQLASEKGAKLRVVPVDESGQVRLEEYGKLLGSKTKLVSFTQVSNALGTITPAKQMIESAHSAGAKVLLDGAQAVSHMRIDVQSLNSDWYVFSGHKVFAPTGIGVLYGKEALLNQSPPWQGGGNMIKDVTFDRTLYQDAPWRFEAGTGNIADAVGLGAAIDYVNKIGLDRIAEYEHQLLLYATRLLKEIPGLRLIGTAPEKAGVLSFVLDGYKTEEVGAALNKEGIAVRSGHHCAQPILRRFGVESTVRPSLALYNTCADIDALIAAVVRLADGRRV
jgi:cysteine desulfurase/selenocysteine lyase